MPTKSSVIAAICCCFASATGNRLQTVAAHPGAVEKTKVAAHMNGAPDDPSTWKQWLETSGRNLGKSIMWFQTDAYEVVFDTVEGPVTFFVNHDEKSNELTLNMFAVDVTKCLLGETCKQVPSSGEKKFNGKVWAQSLFESKCLSLGFTSDGTGHINGVGTQFAREYGGCGNGDIPLRGKALVQVADHLACKFGQTSMELMDASTLQCRTKASVEESMALFYTLKTGRSWYESFGYEYVDKHEDAAHMLQAVGDSDFDWNNLQIAPQHILNAYATHHNKQKWISGPPTVSNRDFIMWVWDVHCDEWKEVINSIFGEQSLARVGGGDMRKTLTCE